MADPIHTQASEGSAGESARAASDGLRLAGATHDVAFVNAEMVGATVRHIMQRWPYAEARGPADAAGITITGGEAGYTITSPWLEEPIERLTEVGAACGAVVESARSYLAAHPDYLCLHCTAFEVGDRLVALAGSNHAGKSTLAARLAAEPVRLYCDDMLPIIGSDTGVALGIPPRPRLPLPERASDRFRDHVRFNVLREDGYYCYLNTDYLAPHGSTAPLGALILLDRRADGPAGFAPTGASEALQHLFMRNLSREQPAEAMADKMQAMMETTPCLKLFYADLEDAVALLLETFGTWPIADLDALYSTQAPGRPRDDEEEKSPRRRTELDPNQRYIRRPDIAARAIEGDLFLVNPANQGILHLNALAGALWTLLGRPLSIVDAAEMLAIAFPDVEPEVIRADVAALFSDLFRSEAILAEG